MDNLVQRKAAVVEFTKHLQKLLDTMEQELLIQPPKAYEDAELGTLMGVTGASLMLRAIQVGREGGCGKDEFLAAFHYSFKNLLEEKTGDL